VLHPNAAFLYLGATDGGRHAFERNTQRGQRRDHDQIAWPLKQRDDCASMAYANQLEDVMREALTEKPAAEPLPREQGEAALFDGHYNPLPADDDGKTWARTSVVVQASPGKLYNLWRDIEAAPTWHERITEVRQTGPQTWHWVMKNEPGDKTLEWDFEILMDEPEKRIAWRSLDGSPRSAGVVTFEAAPGGRGTMVTVLEQFHIGRLSRLWETITGRDPKQSVIENLRHFKALAETGEIARTEPQPHGPRGAVGSFKRFAYGEEIETPSGNTVGEGERS
jgi:uncharacterized membrane protein